MSAEFVDALKGYEYYLKNRGEATIEDVNAYLVKYDRRPIRARTYNHYRKLLANGFRSYIPINQFDVFQSLGKIQMAADRRRYQRNKVQEPAQISGDGKNWENAIIVDRSLVGLGIIALEKFSVSKGTRIWIRLDGYDVMPGILVWRIHDQNDGTTRLGIRAFEFIARYQLTEPVSNASRLTDILQVSRHEEGILSWGHVYRVMEKTNELLDAMSALIYSIDSALDSETQIAQPILVSIKFGSPGELRTKVDLGVAEILRVLIEKFQFWSLDKKRFIEENRKRELENVNFGIEVVRNAINLRKEAIESGMTEDAVATILEPIKTIFNRKNLPKGLFGDGTLERGVLTERVMPVIAELVSGDDPDFEIMIIKATERRQRKITKRAHRDKFR